MRLVYLDEAGISNPEQEPVAVVAGVIVHADNQLEALEDVLDALVKRHIPPEQQPGFAFHALDLFHGRKVFDRDNPHWTLEKRLKIADEIAAIPSQLNLRVALGWIQRNNLADVFTLEGGEANYTNHQKALVALALAFVACSAQIERWMRTYAKGEVCMLVMEDNPSARKILHGAQTALQSKAALDAIPENARAFFPYMKIKESPLFQSKKQSSPLQLADFCAYIFKRCVMKPNDERYLRFVNAMRGVLVTYPPEETP